jgi:hypothetical protein
MFDSHKEVNLWHKQEADKERTVPDHPYQQDKAGLYSDPARRNAGVVLGMVFFWFGRSSVENAPGTRMLCAFQSYSVCSLYVIDVNRTSVSFMNHEHMFIT